MAWVREKESELRKSRMGVIWCYVMACVITHAFPSQCPAKRHSRLCNRHVHSTLGLSSEGFQGGSESWTNLHETGGEFVLAPSCLTSHIGLTALCFLVSLYSPWDISRSQNPCSIMWDFIQVQKCRGTSCAWSADKRGEKREVVRGGVNVTISPLGHNYDIFLIDEDTTFE